MMGSASASGLLRPLDLADPAEVVLFERAFHRGFRESDHNRIIRWLWDWDDENQRLRTRIPYEDQWIWVSYEDDPPGHGVAINWRMALLQAGAFGFTLPEELAAPGKTCEILAIFSWAHCSLSRFHAGWTELFVVLQQRGLQTAVATCASKILPLYRRMGATLLGQRTVDEQERFFLRFDLVRTARWTTRMDDSVVPTQRSDSPSEALAAATEGIGVLLHRLLTILDVARGTEDRAFGLPSVTQGAARMETRIRSQLTAASADPTLAHPIAFRSAQLDHISQLWHSVARFVVLVGQHPFASAHNLVEPLELLLLTAVEAWEGDVDAAETLAALTASDRSRALASIVASAESQGQPALILSDIVSAFAEAIGTLNSMATSPNP